MIRASDGKQVIFDCICSDLFGEGTRMNDFIGLKLVGKYGEVGSSTSTYGTDGKFKVDFPGGLRGATVGG